MVFSRTEILPDLEARSFWVHDGNWMKGFAGGDRYVAFKGTAWGFNKINVLSGIPHNVVNEFCDCNPANPISVCSTQ